MLCINYPSTPATLIICQTLHKSLYKDKLQDKSSAEIEMVVRAVEAMQDLATYVNEAMRDGELLDGMRRIEQSIGDLALVRLCRDYPMIILYLLF